jgi:hypothetical protein
MRPPPPWATLGTAVKVPFDFEVDAEVPVVAV